MRKFFIVLSLIVMFLGGVGLFSSCGVSDKESYLRVHIRANSNSEEDQKVKYLIKDKVVEFITPIVASAKSKDDVENKLLNNEKDIEYYVNQVLKENGFVYGCDMKINNEYFPTRTYDDVTLEANYYDALILNLGSGEGDNWWCVVYPPLCFTNQSNSNCVVYKSKLVEIIKKFFK